MGPAFARDRSLHERRSAGAPAVFGPGSSAVPPPLPPPETAVPGLSNPRYVYLLTRLRNRQITMEEATELFNLQQQMLASALAARGSVPPPPPGPAPAGTAAPAPSVTFNEDSLAFGLLALGAGAGVLAAILKRSQEGPRSAPP
jgi:hypothetical protein